MAEVCNHVLGVYEREPDKRPTHLHQADVDSFIMDKRDDLEVEDGVVLTDQKVLELAMMHRFRFCRACGVYNKIFFRTEY